MTNVVNVTNEIINNLPDHYQKLSDIKIVVKKTSDKFNKYYLNYDVPTKEDIDTIISVLDNCLCLTSRLSQSRSDVQKKLKSYYEETYSSAPAMGKKIYFKEYYRLHQPYDRLKNHIWEILFKVIDYRDQKF